MNQHRSRFKNYLIARHALASEAAVLAPRLQEVYNLAARKRINEWEKVLLFVLAYCEQRRPGQWAMKQKSALPAAVLSLPLDELSDHFLFLKQMPVKSLQELLDNYQLRLLPGAIFQILRKWSRGECRLTLWSHTVTPFEILKHQARGERGVTLDEDASLLGACVDGERDAFEFLLHDLVHADLFFAEMHGEQVRFFSALQKALDSGLMADALGCDLEFQKDFYYLISDMNSSSHHLKALLQASYVKHFLFKEKKRGHDELSEAGKHAVTQHLFRLQNFGQFDISLVADF